VNGTEYANRHAYRAAFSADGDAQRETIDIDARDIDNELSDRAFSDAYDIVQEIAVTILEYLKNGNTNEINLDAPFTHNVLAKRVYRQHEKVVTKEGETTIIRESVRAGRRLIDDARAVSIDTAAAMCYDEEETEIDGETVQIYRRLNKSQVEMFVYESDFGYGADADTVDTVETMLAKIGVRHSEKRILSMLMRGVSVADIADAMGISETAVRKHRTNLQKRAIECGYIPQGYRDTETVTADNAPRAVKQISDGVCVVYDSVKQAAKITGINGGSIRAAAAGKRETAGGYMWEFVTAKA
jgi:DNA-binding NarL/FixJ family response regulator